MKKELHRSHERGTSELDWLRSRFSFSFADYHDARRMGFGALRVLNDDIISAGRGFDFHPHRDMEIITILLSGSLAHKDSLGSEGIISKGEVQVMSAGTGIVHSEFNASESEDCTLLQIWIFPRQKGLSPRYDQKAIALQRNAFTLLVSGEASDDALMINQDARLLRGRFDVAKKAAFSIEEGKGLFLFVIDGEVNAAGESLRKRDALLVSDADLIEIECTAVSDLLLIEVSF